MLTHEKETLFEIVVKLLKEEKNVNFLPNEEVIEIEDKNKEKLILVLSEEEVFSFLLDTEEKEIMIINKRSGDAIRTIELSSLLEYVRKINSISYRDLEEEKRCLMEKYISLKALLLTSASIVTIFASNGFAKTVKKCDCSKQNKKVEKKEENLTMISFNKIKQIMPQAVFLEETNIQVTMMPQIQNKIKNKTKKEFKEKLSLGTFIRIKETPNAFDSKIFFSDSNRSFLTPIDKIYPLNPTGQKITDFLLADPVLNEKLGTFLPKLDLNSVVTFNKAVLGAGAYFYILKNDKNSKELWAKEIKNDIAKKNPIAILFVDLNFAPLYDIENEKSEANDKKIEAIDYIFNGRNINVANITRFDADANKTKQITDQTFGAPKYKASKRAEIVTQDNIMQFIMQLEKNGLQVPIKTKI